jgi:sulfatase maturation enzyme AslB (radical SAM superfamily)
VMPIPPPLECAGCHIDWWTECQRGCPIHRFATGAEEAEERQRERESEFARGEGPFARKPKGGDE